MQEITFYNLKTQGLFHLINICDMEFYKNEKHISRKFCHLTICNNLVLGQEKNYG